MTHPRGSPVLKSLGTGTCKGEGSASKGSTLPGCERWRPADADWQTGENVSDAAIFISPPREPLLSSGNTLTENTKTRVL